MPNHVENIITLKGDEQKIREMLEIIKNDDYGLGTVDFNKGIPMPESCDWYEWSINNWGTKWTAYGYDKNTDYSKNENLWFQTAWSAPHPILQKLSEMYPTITFEHQWADEDLGMNCGKREYSGGEVIDEYFPEGIRATEFALEVWDYDPEELGIAKNSTGTEYVCIDCEKYELIELFGKPALFSNDRITPKDIPQGLYCYDLRHSDNGDRFAAVEPKVTVNHGGSVITNEPLDFGENGYISFNEEAYPNFTGNKLTMSEYLHGEFKQSQDESQKIGGMRL